MTKISTDSPREIIEDFAQAIANRKKQPKKPDQGVINFRKEVQDGIPRPVWEVPLEFLRFRKDNGRITSDVLSYETLPDFDLHLSGNEAGVGQFGDTAKDSFLNGILQKIKD